MFSSFFEITKNTKYELWNLYMIQNEHLFFVFVVKNSKEVSGGANLFYREF